MAGRSEERDQPAEWELVVAAQAGDVAAFTLLTERHYAALLRSLARQTGDPDLAADLTQETFVRAFEHLGQLTDAQSFAAWLYQIARNARRMAQRRERLRRWVSLDWLAGRTGRVAPALRQPDATAAYHERELLERALAGCSPPLREALVLHSLDGFTGEEVARMLGISPAAARQRIGRARRTFRERYGAMHGALDDRTL